MLIVSKGDFMNKKINHGKISFKDIMGKVTDLSLDEIIGMTNSPVFDDMIAAVNQEIVKNGGQTKYDDSYDALGNDIPEDLAEVMDDGTLRPCTEEERKNFCYHR